MKKALILVGILVVIGLVGNSLKNKKEESNTNTDNITDTHMMDEEHPVTVTPISHATAVLEWDGTTIYTDPVGGADAFDGQPEADIILVTDIHGDHFHLETLESVVGSQTKLIVPQVVLDELTEDLAAKAMVVANDQLVSVGDFKITGFPAYNVPESADAFHTKGRGNGYLIEHDGYTVYVAGDTAGTPEMRGLQNIDLAFIPMNLPYTMSVEDAAAAVLAFAPKHVYPYHYRGPDGLSDVAHFKELVDAGGKDIEVVLEDWYPED